MEKDNLLALPVLNKYDLEIHLHQYYKLLDGYGNVVDIKSYKVIDYLSDRGFVVLQDGVYPDLTFNVRPDGLGPSTQKHHRQIQQTVQDREIKESASPVVFENPVKESPYEGVVDKPVLPKDPPYQFNKPKPPTIDDMLKSYPGLEYHESKALQFTASDMVAFVKYCDLKRGY